MSILILLSVGILILLIALGLQRVQRKSLPRMDVKDFLSSFRLGEEADYSSEEILSARDKVAGYLGIAPDLLRPDDSVQWLVKEADVLGDVRIGWGDLINDVSSLQAENGVDFREDLESVRHYVKFLIDNDGL